MRRLLLACLLFLLAAPMASAKDKPFLAFPKDFIWGVASAAYQVEGAYKEGGRGVAVWDVYTNKYDVSNGDTGNVAIDQYHRYKEDIASLKKMGVDSYRFSISWPRLIPDGDGNVNPEGVAYYNAVIDECLRQGIKPAITLFHWDFPQALMDKGGWETDDVIEWYDNYAKVAFELFGDRVKTWITFNEPYIDLVVFEPLLKNKMNPYFEHPKNHPFEIPDTALAMQAQKTHRLMMANARAIHRYHDMFDDGEIGITLNLCPTFPATKSMADFNAAKREDGILNRWFLDPALKGSYPEDTLKFYRQFKDVTLLIKDLDYLKANRGDFIGINYYSPLRIQADETSQHAGLHITPNPNKDKAFNGESYPQGLYELLRRLDQDYGHPSMYITENGAGYGVADDTVKKGRVTDPLRQRYLNQHLREAHRAISDGVDLKGYYYWSAWDNFEWFSGYKNRFGLIHVDFATQKRTWKDSAFVYQGIVTKNGVSAE